MERSKKERMEDLGKDVDKCEDCELYKEATNGVPGEGNSNADILLIGEAPGANEDKQGRPFVGKAGQVLDQLLEHVGLKREEVYIANILKHRPPKNRNPKAEEIEACTPYLDRQIKIIQPKVIGCLGNFATKYILKKFGFEDQIKGITKLHGQVLNHSSLDGTIKIVPLFHPAVVTYNANKIEDLKKDFEIIREVSEG